jgi:hypothetical protein
MKVTGYPLLLSLRLPICVMEIAGRSDPSTHIIPTRASQEEPFFSGQSCKSQSLEATTEQLGLCQELCPLCQTREVELRSREGREWLQVPGFLCFDFDSYFSGNFPEFFFFFWSLVPTETEGSGLCY